MAGQTTTLRWGSSLAVTIPDAVARLAGLDEGTPVSVTFEGGRVVIAPAISVPTLEELVARITPENAPPLEWPDDVIGTERDGWGADTWKPAG